MKIFTLTIFTLISFYSQAQQFKNNVGAPFIGLSAYMQQPTSAGMLSNVATLGGIQNSGGSVFAERRFGLTELNNITATGAVHTKAGAIGITVNRFGFSDFNETQAGIGYGRSLNGKILVGAKINYYNQQIPQYGNSGTVNAEAGILLKLTNKLTSGVSVFNPVGGKFGINNTEQLNAVYKLGLGYAVSDKVNIAAEAVKTANEKLNFISMLHYQFEQKFFARVGISSSANTFFGSAGINLAKQFRLEVCASYHQQLGFTPGLLLVIE